MLFFSLCTAYSLMVKKDLRNSLVNTIIRIIYCLTKYNIIHNFRAEIQRNGSGNRSEVTVNC